MPGESVDMWQSCVIFRSYLPFMGASPPISRTRSRRFGYNSKGIPGKRSRRTGAPGSCACSTTPHTNGRHEEALRWLEPTWRSLYRIPDYAAMSGLRMAQMYDELGNAEKALDHYSVFVEIWKDCDPEFRSLLDQAQERIAALQSKVTSSRAVRANSREML